VATHAALKSLGLAPSTITRRIGPDGPWQRLLPGVVLAHRGTPTRLERRLGAQHYGGGQSVITGLDALSELGVRTAQRLLDPKVHVLVPHSSHRTSHGFAVVTRTRRLPPTVERRGLRCAPLARSLVDACRRLENLDDVRELVADVVQNHGLEPAALLVEIRAAARQRTALARAVVREISAGVRSVAEARLRGAFRRFGVPEPLWNAELRTAEGDFVARPDAYWADAGVALEIDSMAWHLSPGRYKRTQRRQRNLTVHGVEVLPVAPSDVLADPEELCRQVMQLLRGAVDRPVPTLQVTSLRVA